MKNSGWKIAVIVLGVICFLLLIVTTIVGLNAGIGMESYKKAAGGVAVESMEEAYDSGETASTAAPLQDSRKIIVNATVSLTVKKLAASVSEAEVLVEKNGGYVENASFITGEDASRRADLVLRIPANKFDLVMAKLRKMAIGVGDESISRTDVTLEYVDVAARLENMLEHEKALQELWSKANTVEDMIKIEGELARVRGEIESLTAQRKALESQIQLATINLYMSEDPASLPANAKGEGLLQQSGNALVRSLQLIKYTAGLLVIILAGLLPIGIIVLVLALLIRSFLRWHKKKRMPVKQ